MRSPWTLEGLKSNEKYPYQKKGETETHRRENHMQTRGRGWSDGSTSHRILRNAMSHQTLRELWYHELGLQHIYLGSTLQSTTHVDNLFTLLTLQKLTPDCPTHAWTFSSPQGGSHTLAGLPFYQCLLTFLGLTPCSELPQVTFPRCYRLIPCSVLHCGFRTKFFIRKMKRGEIY